MSESDTYLIRSSEFLISVAVGGIGVVACVKNVGVFQAFLMKGLLKIALRQGSPELRRRAQCEGDLYLQKNYAFLLSLSKHEWIIFRGYLKYMPRSFVLRTCP